MLKENKLEVSGPKPELFTPLSKTESGLFVVSPPSVLRVDETYDDQVLEDIPSAAEMNVENIELLFEKGIIPKGPIVDVGCGTGILVQRLRAIGYQAHGIEIIDSLGQNWARRGIDQCCYIGNIEDVPGVQSDSFVLVTTRAFWDSAFGADGKGGTNDPRRSLKEISRIIKPKGVYFAMSDNNRHFDRITEIAREVGLLEFQVTDISTRHSRLFNKA